MSQSLDHPTPAVLHRGSRRFTPWQQASVSAILAILCAVWLYWSTIMSMTQAWLGSRTFAHGVLVLPATGYLLWCRRSSLVGLIPAPTAMGLVCLALTGALWVAGTVTNSDWLQQVAVIAMLPGILWAIMGSDVVRQLAWPLGFLVFMLPVGTSFEPWLQDLTGQMIVVGLGVTGIPYLYEGHFITLPSGTWEVAPDCGGLRYLLPGLAVGYAFSALVYRQPIRRWLFLVVCAVVLILANGLRAYGVMVGDYLGITEGADHRVFSYTIYGFTVLWLFWFGLRWQEHSMLPPSAATSELVGVLPILGTRSKWSCSR